MKKFHALLSVCIIQFVFNAFLFAQQFDLTPRIQDNSQTHKSELVRNKLPGNVELRDVIFKEKAIKSATSGQTNFIWGKYMASSYSDRFFETEIDLWGNVIAVGYQAVSSSDADAIIYKFDNLGNILWSDKPAISSNWDGIYSIATDKIGNIFITGRFYSSAFESNIYSHGDGDIFIAKYNPEGTLLWARNAGGSYEDYGCGIALDDAGNVFVVGFFNGTAYWDGIAKTSSTQGDMFIAKYDYNGNAIWVKKGDVGESNYLYGISVDKSGNAYVSSKFSGDLHFEGASIVSSAGGNDMFLIKYDALGTFKWLKTAGGAGADDGGNDVVIDSDGNILVAGYFSDNALFGNKTLTAHGTYDIFAAKYTPTGNLLWVKQFGGTGSQSAWGVNTDGKGNCYLTGWFSGTGAFDNTTIVSGGGADAYIIKYDKNGNLIWVEQTATGLDEQVGTDIFATDDELAVSGYYTGDMYIQGVNYPPSGGEDAYLASLAQSNDIQTTVYVNPSLSLSSVQVTPGQTIIFSGKQFSPAGKVDLSFSGFGTISPVNDYSVDIYGNFQYSLTIASYLKSGTYSIAATDKISGKSVSRNFQIIESTVVDDFLKIVEPNISKLRFTGDPIAIAWEDMVKFDINPLYNLKHSYKVEYKRDTDISGGAWQSVQDIHGANSGYGNLNLSTVFTPTLEGNYIFRVTDNYHPGRSATTPVLPVSGYLDQDIRVLFKWDKSYFSPVIQSPDGAAADGVARFYMVVSNINTSSSAIQKVKVTLSDAEGYQATQYLGKVKYCLSQNDNKFTDEANNANSIVSENTSSNVDGNYWFWYVAPDDFARNEGDWGIGERLVKATFEITLLNGNTITTKRDIKIARPPLMLVHGLNGDPVGTWGNFQIGSDNPLYYNDSRFKIKKAVRMDPNSHFKINSSQLLAGIENDNSFIWLINEMRNSGYACNQLDYVCHSMGGSIFRDAFENTDSYHRDNSYKKGYVNKFISINTPHQGSSLANVLNDVGNTWLLNIPIIGIDAIGNLINPKIIPNFWEISPLSIKVVGAVEDLKYENGIKFNITDVHSHLIGSGIPCSSFNLKTSILYKFLKNNLGLLVPGSELLSQCMWYQTYFDLFGYESDFIDASDAIVSLTSQFSGYSGNNLPSNCTRISGPMHNSFFGESPMHSIDVSNSVNELLNKNVNSDLFSTIPATNVPGKKSDQPNPKKQLAIVEDRIKILYPLSNAVYYAGDTMSIKLQVDTLGLKSFALFFQDQSFFDTPVSPFIEFKLIVSPEYIENQNILVLGNYSVSDMASISTADLEIKVTPVGSILDFKVKPQVLMIEKGKTRLPDYEAVFSDAIAKIGQTDLISVSIVNPLLVSFNNSSNQFTGLEKGSTSATVTYRGKSTTAFFEIIQYEEPPVDPFTGINDIGIENTNLLNVNVYPNPIKGILTITTKEKECVLNIINGLGERILSQKIQNGKTEINLSGQSNGIYLLDFYSKNGRTIKKIIISK